MQDKEKNCYKQLPTEDFEKKLNKRMYTIEAIFDSLQKAGQFPAMKLIIPSLRIALISYFTDIGRAKCYHNIPYADAHKKAAFTVKWICKFKPIQFRDNIDLDVDVTRENILANEIFAVYMALVFLNINPDDLSNKYFENLVYICTYRNIEDLTLSSNMYVLERAVIGGNV